MCDERVRKRSKRRKQLRKRSRLLIYFSVGMFMAGLVMLINFEALTLNLNEDYYEKESAVVMEVGEDPLFGVLPRARLNYKYGGISYEANKIMYTGFFFENYKLKQGSQVSIYVNKKAPENILVVFTLTSSIVSLILLFVFIFCMFEIFKTIFEDIEHRIKLEREKKNLVKEATL